MTTLRGVVLAIVTVVAGALAPATAASASPAIVLGPSAAGVVAATGGEVERDLPSIDAVEARLSAAQAARVRARGHVVVDDVPMRVAGASHAAVTSPEVQLAAMNPVPKRTGAGVTVAVVDTGVVSSPAFGSRLVHAPDFSGEGNVDDGYGHGTFMAGLIAGSETGSAPGARLVSVKVAGRDGSTSLSAVLAGIDWVLQHREEHGIRVLSLSLSVVPRTAWQADPLVMAVEAAWQRGITVVVAAGNEGDRVTSPGLDPRVLTVGASSTAGTATTADDSRPAWSGQEPTPFGPKPEVVAPGVSVVSLRAPGSTIDAAYPKARVGKDWFRGSGTSMATALTAGAAAVLSSANPTLTPDQIKAAVVRSADPVAGSLGAAVDVAGALAERVTDLTPGGPGGPGAPAPGRALGLPVDTDGTGWAGTGWAGTGWAGTGWAGTGWAGTGWAGTGWAGTGWAGTGWAGTGWAGTGWAGTGWAGTGWAAASWMDG